MKIVELIRLYTGNEYGTLGILKIDKMPFCVTLEPYDRDNAKGISNIPAQQYVCQPYSSAKYKNVYEIMNVPGRTNILFHAGNTIDDTEGCILLGQYFDKLATHTRAVLNSGKTFDKFRSIIGDNRFHLTIIEMY